jgi:hypothetical protein
MVDLSNQRIANDSVGYHGQVALEVFKCLACGLALAALFLASAWIRSDILKTQYDLQALKRANQELRQANELLMVEYQVLSNPAEIEKEAKRLGLVSSNEAQVTRLRAFPASTATQVAEARENGRLNHE